MDTTSSLVRQAHRLVDNIAAGLDGGGPRHDRALSRISAATGDEIEDVVQQGTAHRR